MKNELEIDPTISEIYVVVRVGMPCITATALILKKSAAGWHMSYSSRNSQNEKEVTKNLRNVLGEELRTFIEVLERSRQLKSYYGVVKDGVRYEMALTNELGRLNLTIANPLSGQEHFDVVNTIERTLRSVSDSKAKW
jgi:hypothetical protein